MARHTVTDLQHIRGQAAIHAFGPRPPAVGDEVFDETGDPIGVVIVAARPGKGSRWERYDRKTPEDAVLRWSDLLEGWVRQPELEEKTIPTPQQIEGVMVAAGLPAGLPILDDTLVAGPGVTGPAPTAAQFDRLLALLSLTPQERAFVRAALELDAEADLFDVVADYLEESGRPVSARFREGEAVRQEREACLVAVQGVQTMGGRGDTYADGYRQAVVQATAAIRARGGANT